LALKVIDGGNKPNDFVECPKCGCLTFIEVTQMIRRKGKNTDAGMKAKACAACMTKGELVIV